MHRSVSKHLKIPNRRRRHNERTFPIKEPRRIFARERHRLRELADELDDLRYVVFVFTVPRAGLGVEEVVAAGEELEELWCVVWTSVVSVAVVDVGREWWELIREWRKWRRDMRVSGGYKQ